MDAEKIASKTTSCYIQPIESTALEMNAVVRETLKQSRNDCIKTSARENENNIKEIKKDFRENKIKIHRRK